ncbi:MAG TPA: hypothetical protein VGV68_04570 [Terriglobia bacterium]|nr:hypothetical protein [Terriglobia bacterium]
MFTCIGMLMVACALVTPAAIPPSGDQRADKAEVLLKGAQHKQLVDGDLEAAIRDYKNYSGRLCLESPGSRQSAGRNGRML